MTIADEIRSLTEQGICLIPVGEKRHEGFEKKAFIKWGDLARPFTATEVYDLIGKYNTNSVASLCGPVSGNLICIDVDSKFKPGFDAVILKDIRDFYPELYSRMRIEKSPSGGLHFLYKIGFSLEDVTKVDAAKRLSTEDELAADDKRKTRCFIEIKGKGQLAQTYPSEGYKLIQGPEIPEFTWEEHCSLHKLCCSYNEVVKVETVKVGRDVSEFYSVNPYEDFNNSEKGRGILEAEGWTIYKENSVYTYYRRPGQESKHVSAGFNHVKKQYTIFSTSADIDAKTYPPSLLLSFLKFGDDRKKLFAYLVSEGFGKIKPECEKNIIKRRVNDGLPLPANISDEGKAQFEIEKAAYTEKYPFGTFWEINDKGTILISREDLYRIAGELGYRTHPMGLCWISGYKIWDLTENEFFNGIKSYIKEEGVDVFNCYENFLQNSGKFTISRLPELDRSLILRSEKLVSYKFYNNKYVKIEPKTVEFLDYKDLNKLIWERDILKRDIRKASGLDGIWFDFLDKAIGVDDYLLCCIGYYLHSFRDENGYFVLTTEKCENPKEGAGAGKNVFWDMMKCGTTHKSTAASMIKKDNQLLQSWNGEKVFCLSDMPKNFDLIFFKDIITGNAVVRKLYKDEYTVPIEDMCKLGGSSNYSYDNTDPGVDRRVRAIEFTNYFTLLGADALKGKYGKMFPGGFDEDDYLNYDTVMIAAIQTFLNNDCKIEKLNLSVGGWRKQFEQKYSHLHELIEENIENWIEKGRISNPDLAKEYDTFCKDNSVKNKYSAPKMNAAFEEYCAHHKIYFETKNVVWKEMTLNVRGRKFGDKYRKNEIGLEVIEELESQPF